MPAEIEQTIEAPTVRHLIGVTRQQLADGLKDAVLIKAAQKGTGKLKAVFSSFGSESIKLQVADHLSAAVDIDPVELFAGAWVKYTELKKCAKQTQDERGSTQDVRLAEHEFSYGQETTLDLLLDGVKITTIPLRFEIACEVSGLELFLKEGSVYEVRSGELSWKAAFECAGEMIWSRSLDNVHLPGVLKLRNPVPIAR